MAFFGRNSARNRLRRAASETLKVSSFSAPIDCTPWVAGGLWPVELSTVSEATLPLVKHLKADLQRIVDSANAELRGLRQAGLDVPTRQLREGQIIDEARGFAIKRVASTVRLLQDGYPAPKHGSGDVLDTGSIITVN